MSHVASPSTARAVEDRVRALMRSMRITEPVTMRELIDRYAEYAQVDVDVITRRLPVDFPAAMTIGVAETRGYAITVQAETTRWHQDIGLGHEFGHIVCGHYDRAGGHDAMTPLMEWEAEATAKLLDRWSYELRETLDKQRSIRPLRAAADVAAPLRDRIAWL